MHWTSFAEFLAMGGYATFVWPAVAVAVIVIGWLTYASLSERNAARRELADLEQDGATRRRGGA